MGVGEKVQAAYSLIDSGVDLDALDVITPLYAAQEYVRSSKQRHALLKRMLNKGAAVDGPTQDGTTTLMLASYHGDVRSAHLLLEHGADPLRKNNAGYDAMAAASQSNNLELAETLREFIGESGLRYAGA